jgi:hypothetical protein
MTEAPTIDELLAAIATLSDDDREALGERLASARRTDGDCGTDGHYMCHECERAQICERCGEIDARCECEDEFA